MQVNITPPFMQFTFLLTKDMSFDFISFCDDYIWHLLSHFPLKSVINFAILSSHPLLYLFYLKGFIFIFHFDPHVMLSKHHLCRTNILRTRQVDGRIDTHKLYMTTSDELAPMDSHFNIELDILLSTESILNNME